MKCLTILAALTLTGCGLADPYPGLKEGLWITFMENPAAPDGMCNPVIEAAYRGELEPVTIELEMRASYFEPTMKTINKRYPARTKLVLEPSSIPGLMLGRSEMFDGEAFEGTCKDMSLHLLRKNCLESNGQVADQCPNSRRTGGLQYFGFVQAGF